MTPWGWGKHFYTIWGGGQTFLHHGGDIFTQGGEGQTFSVGGDGGDDVDGKDEDVSEANTLASEASKLSTGARILRGPQGPEILV